MPVTSAHPCTATMPFFGIDADDNPAGKLATGLFDQFRIALGGRADDHPADAESQIGFDGGDIADAAAQLGRNGDAP